MELSKTTQYDHLVNTARGQCFRYVEGEGGRPVGCPGEVEWRGHFQPPKGSLRIVEACDLHSGGLYRPVPTPRRTAR